MAAKGRNLKELEILAIDCQATHNNPDEGHILEIGWITTHASAGADFAKISEDTESFLLKIPSQAEISRAVSRITGITREELKTARTPREIWSRLSRTAEDVIKNIGLEDTSRTIQNKATRNLELGNGEACPAVIHFCRYEEPFLRKLHKKYSPKKEFPFSIVCTHEIVKRLLPGLPRKSLRAVTGYFGQSLPDSRRSCHHVAATALLWSHLVKLLEDIERIHTYGELQEWLRQPPARFHDNKGSREYPMPEIYKKNLSDRPGVYRMYRSEGDLLYVGKAKSLKHRINSYFHKGCRHPEHILEMLSQAKYLETTVTRTAVEAALIESDEIKRSSPPYNRALRRNEREVLFFSRDLKSVTPQPDSLHSIGPLPSSYNLYPLILLVDVLNGNMRRVSMKVVEGILDIPSEYLPDRDCFVSGLKAFQHEFQRPLHSAFDKTAWMALGAHFWKEKLEEKAAREAEKREFTEAALVKKEALESAARKEVAGEDMVDELEESEILKLKMQEFEDKEIVDGWTPERIVKVLKSIIRNGAFQIRRSRWFCRLSESALVWTLATGDVEKRNRIVFEGGVPFFKDPLSPSEMAFLAPGHRKSLLERQKNFDILVFDRMRITTTEIRRLIQEERCVELSLHPDACLRKEQLERMLLWV
jgi:DNA polymerase-3 subunit epsilon